MKRFACLLAFLAGLIVGLPAEAAPPAFVGQLCETSDPNGAPLPTNLTCSATVSAGSDLALIVAVGFVDNVSTSSVTGCTFGAAPLTQVVTNTGFRLFDWWILFDPAVSTADVTCNFSEGISSSRITVYQYSNADATGATSTQDTVGTDLSINLTTTVSDAVALAGSIFRGNDGDPFTPIAPSTERADGSASGPVSDSSVAWTDLERTVTSPGAVNLASTPSVSDSWAMAAFELKPPAAVAASSSQLLTLLGAGGSTAAPTFPPPVCSPANQSVLTGQAASFAASAGNGIYSWTATGGIPATGNGSSFQTAYSSSGSKTVTVTSAAQTDDCAVTVTTGTAGPGATGRFYAWTDGKIYDPDGILFTPRGTGLIPGTPASSYETPLGPTCWNMNFVRLNWLEVSPPSESAFDAMIDGLTLQGKVVMVTFHRGTPFYGFGQGESATTKAETTAFLERLSTKYANNPYVWYSVNEPGALDAEDIGGGVWRIEQQSLDNWEAMQQGFVDIIRGNNAKGLIVLPSLFDAQDTIRSDGFNFAVGFDEPLDERSAIIKHGAVVKALDTQPGGTAFDVHLYGNYNRAEWGVFLEDFVDGALARGHAIIFGEYGACAPGFSCNVPGGIISARNMRDLEPTRYFGTAIWHGNASDHFDLTTSAPVTGTLFGIRDIQTCANPTNLTEAGQITYTITRP